MPMSCWWLTAKVAEGRAIKFVTGNKNVEAKAPGKAALPQQGSAAASHILHKP